MREVERSGGKRNFSMFGFGAMGYGWTAGSKWRKFWGLAGRRREYASDECIACVAFFPLSENVLAMRVCEVVLSWYSYFLD